MSMLKVQTKLMTELKQIHMKGENTLTWQGSDDTFCSFKGTKYGHNQVSNSQLKKYEGAYHALHAELPKTTDAFWTILINLFLPFYSDAPNQFTSVFKPICAGWRSHPAKESLWAQKPIKS